MKKSTLYGLQGGFEAKEGQKEQLAEILLEAADLMKSAQGCRLYAVSFDTNQANQVCVTEIWDSKEDHDNSLNLAGVRELIGKAIPLLAGNPTKGQELEILGGFFGC
ncbi:MAG: putative quinol monooxygenase [Saprospiraceae bacterium]